MWWSNKKGFLGGVPIKRRKRHLEKFPGDVRPLQLLNNIFLTFQRQLYLKNLIGWSWFRSCTNLGDQWVKLPNIVSVFRLEDLPMKLDYPILHPKTMWLRKSSRILTYFLENIGSFFKHYTSSTYQNYNIFQLSFVRDVRYKLTVENLTKIYNILLL